MRTLEFFIMSVLVRDNLFINVYKYRFIDVTLKMTENI